MEELNQGTVDFRSGFQSLLGVCRALLQRGLAPSASAAGSRHSRYSESGGAEGCGGRHVAITCRQRQGGIPQAPFSVFTDATPEITVLIAVTLHMRL